MPRARTPALGGWANPNNTQDGDTAHPDDLIGWNFVNNTNNPLDDNGHGTEHGGHHRGDGQQRDRRRRRQLDQRR